jgi:flagellar biosynthesis/type III secretory pathway M-ring protein FliF/YscJ
MKPNDLFRQDTNYDPLAEGAEASIRSRQEPEQSDAESELEGPDLEYKQHFSAKHDTRPVSTRLTRDQDLALKRYALEQDRRISDIIREWIQERMRKEGII